MKKERIGKTAQTNLRMLAMLGVEEAKKYQSVLQFEDELPGFIPRSAILCIASVAEILYNSGNALIEKENNPYILDIACGYSPRAYKMIPKGYSYIGTDLSNVVEDIKHHLSYQKGYEDYLSRYQFVDVSDEESMKHVTENVDGKITIVTQGLLSYLNAEQKHHLCMSIKNLLKEKGGCWLIPDCHPDRMLKDTFKAIMGDNFLVEQIYNFLDLMISRNKNEINWKTCDEIIQGLKEEGFEVELIPLWNESLDMRVLNKLDLEQKEALIETWKHMHSIKVTVK